MTTADLDPLDLAIQAAQQQYEVFTGDLGRLVGAAPLLEQLAAFGTGEAPLELFDNDRQWVDHYGLQFDGVPFDWHWYKHLAPVYEDDHDFLTLMAGAQTGKTARLNVKLTRAMLRHWGSLFGYYFPDLHLPAAFSTQRLRPFWSSNPELAKLAGTARRSGQKGTDNVLTRTLGESTLFLMSVKGKTSTEGLPLKGVFFDEVRRMAPGDIERAMERYSAQFDPIDVKVSTARYPKQDIDKSFREGDQRYFHTACSCPDGVVLSLTYPHCIADLRSASPQLRRKVEHAHRHLDPDLGQSRAPEGKFLEAAYLCPTCGDILPDPREGWWEAHAVGDGSRPHSYQMPQLLSPTYPAGRVLHKAEHAEDLQELHNSMLGLAYIDESRRGVTTDEIESCIEPGLQWVATRSPRWRSQNLRNSAMGVDVQGGYLVAVVKGLAPNGKYRTLHLQVVHGSHANDPWHTLGRMMTDYNVRICVMDGQPEYSAALRFARAFPRRVWLASFVTDAEAKTPMVDWKDLSRKKERGRDTTFKYRVTIEKVKGFQWSLGRWGRGANELPPPRGLVQRLPLQGDQMAWAAGLRVGRWAPYAILPHLHGLADEHRVCRRPRRPGRLDRRSEEAGAAGGSAAWWPSTSDTTTSPTPTCTAMSPWPGSGVRPACGGSDALRRRSPHARRRRGPRPSPPRPAYLPTPEGRARLGQDRRPSRGGAGPARSPGRGGDGGTPPPGTQAPQPARSPRQRPAHPRGAPLLHRDPPPRQPRPAPDPAPLRDRLPRLWRHLPDPDGGDRP